MPTLSNPRTQFAAAAYSEVQHVRANRKRAVDGHGTDGSSGRSSRGSCRRLSAREAESRARESIVRAATSGSESTLAEASGLSPSISR